MLRSWSLCRTNLKSFSRSLRSFGSLKEVCVQSDNLEGKSTSEKLRRQRLSRAEGAAIFQAVSPTTTPTSSFEPLTTQNFDASGKMPATLVLQGEAHCRGVGTAELSADTNFKNHNIEATGEVSGIGRAGFKCDESGNWGASGECFYPDQAVHVRGVWDSDGDLSLQAVLEGQWLNAKGQDPWEAPIQGQLVFDSFGNLVEGKLEMDLVGVLGNAAESFPQSICQQVSTWLGNNSVDELQIWMAENGFGAKINLGGLILSADRKSFDVSGSRESSTFKYDETTGALKHYYGETEVTTGTVDALYLGAGVGESCFGVGASMQGKLNVSQDYDVNSQKKTHEVDVTDEKRTEAHTETAVQDHSHEGILFSNKDVRTHTEQHSFDALDGKTVESEITTNTVDNSFSCLGIKIGGEETTRVHSETTTTTTDGGLFTNTVTRETVTEDVEYVQEHSLLDSEITILRDDKEVEALVEHTLTEAGCGALVILVKPAVKVFMAYMEDGKLDMQDVVHVVVRTSTGVVGLAALTRVLGSSNAALATITLASIIPKILQEEYAGARQDVLRLFQCLLAARIASYATTGFLFFVGMGPYAAIGGTAAGIAGSTVAAGHLDLNKALERLQAARKRRQILKLCA